MDNIEAEKKVEGRTRPEGAEAYGRIHEMHAMTAASIEHPERNDDAAIVLPESGALGVFDGVGSAREAGGVAAREAAGVVRSVIQNIPPDAAPERVRRDLALAFREAHALLARMFAAEPDRLRGLATTATVGVVRKNEAGKDILTTAQIGDSRMYVWRASADRIEQVTVDDSLVGAYVRDPDAAREISIKLDTVESLEELTDFERDLFHRRNVIARALGIKGDAEPSFSETELYSGDRWFAVSDGVSDNLTTGEIETIVRNSPSVERAVEELVFSARKRSRDVAHVRSKPDDITAVGAEPSIEEMSIEERIAASRTFDDLYRELDRLHGVTGSLRRYGAEELKDLIERVRENPGNITWITSTHGLRAKVDALMAEELIRRGRESRS